MSEPTSESTTPAWPFAPLGGPEPGRWLPIDETAARFNAGPLTVYRAAMIGWVRTTLQDGAIRYSENDVTTWDAIRQAAARKGVYRLPLVPRPDFA